MKEPLLWFKLWNSDLLDPACANLSDKAFRKWVQLQGLESRNLITNDDSKIAKLLQMRKERWIKVKNELLSAHLIDSQNNPISRSNQKQAHPQVVQSWQVELGKNKNLTQISSSCKPQEGSEVVQNWQAESLENNDFAKTATTEEADSRHGCPNLGNFCASASNKINGLAELKKLENIYKEKNNKKEKLEPEPEYPDWLDVKAWKEFVAYRKDRNRALVTKESKLRFFEDLKKLLDDGYSNAAVIFSAIDANWLTFFPPTVKRQKQYPLLSEEKPDNSPENWRKIKEIMRQKIGEGNKKSWLDPLSCTETETAFELRAPTRFIREWVGNNFLKTLKFYAKEVVNKDVQIMFVQPEIKK